MKIIDELDPRTIAAPAMQAARAKREQRAAFERLMCECPGCALMLKLTGALLEGLTVFQKEITEMGDKRR